MIKPVQELEDQDQEIVWGELCKSQTNVYIGVYYGPQEKCSKEEIDRQFSQLTSQISKLKRKGEIILMSDFNSKTRN